MCMINKPYCGLICHNIISSQITLTPAHFFSLARRCQKNLRRKTNINYIKLSEDNITHCRAAVADLK